MLVVSEDASSTSDVKIFVKSRHFQLGGRRHRRCFRQDFKNSNTQIQEKEENTDWNNRPISRLIPQCACRVRHIKLSVTYLETTQQLVLMWIWRSSWADVAVSSGQNRFEQLQFLCVQHLFLYFLLKNKPIIIIDTDEHLAHSCSYNIPVMRLRV